MLTKNKKKIKILVDQGFSQEYADFLSKKYDLEIFKFVKDDNGYYPRNIDLVVFTGGADVTPSFYNEEIGKHTQVSSKRDEIESNIFHHYEYTPKLGICRGSQFLTVMSGGKLIQHVNGHLGNHNIHLKSNIKDFYNERNSIVNYEITSTHHQMMFPFNLKPEHYNILAWSSKFKSTTYLDGNNEEIPLPEKFVEPEIVYYPNSYSLCVQGHPEMRSCPDNTSLLILRLIETKLLSENKVIQNEVNEW